MNEWEETKKYLRQIQNNWQDYLSAKMNNVKITKDTKKGNYYEYRFLNNGFECFIQAQEFVNKSNEDFYRILAFNDKTNTCFVRYPLKEELHELLWVLKILTNGWKKKMKKNYKFEPLEIKENIKNYSKEPCQLDLFEE